MFTSEQTLEQAKAFARDEQDKLQTRKFKASSEDRGGLLFIARGTSALSDREPLHCCSHAKSLRRQLIHNAAIPCQKKTAPSD